MPTLENDAVVFRFPDIDPEAKLSINFQRTLRIPDTNADYPLPPGLGRFPLRHVEDFPALPEHTLRRGGVILPIWQAEALWLNFDGNFANELPVAIKVAAGKINAVTGEVWSSQLNRNPQDYMVWPEQPWLDGFAVEPGVVRQFVAIKLNEGYTVEEQLTREAEWGGLQISVTPMRKEAWERLNEPELMESINQLVLSCESVEMGLSAGGRMRQAIERDPHDLDDWDQRATQRLFVTLAHASHWPSLTGEVAPTHAPTAKAYARAGLPWYEHYGLGQAPVPGAKRLAGVNSVGSLFKKKTFVTLPASQDIPPPNTVKIGPGVRAARQIKSTEDW